MTLTADQTPPAAPAPRPLRLAMLVPTLIVDVALPIAVLKTLEAMGVAPVWALAAGCVPPLLNNLRVWIGRRRLDPAGILIMISMASGVAGSLLTGDIGSRIVTDCLLSSAWGLGFLGSLLLARPALFYLIRALVAGDDNARAETWNGLWRYAAFRASLRSLTAIWGLSYFAGIALELGLARLLPIETVVTIGPALNLGATVLLIVFTRFRMKAARERLEREEQLTWPL
jgi:hypothetical protein